MTTPTKPYAGLQPPDVWRHFAALNQIPRPSGHEAAAIAYARSCAEQAGATSREDAFGNIVVKVPASGCNGAPVTAIQAHLDMVCQQLPDGHHNFDTDPIEVLRDGNVVRALGTTLGADNGIGAALALSLLSSPPPIHGPLELIFTVQEETGLHGALALDATLLHATYLINLDSEDPDELTVGCAGGAGVNLHLPVSREPLPAGWVPMRLSVGGLRGGHSGVQIHEPLANAIKLLVQSLQALACNRDLRLLSIDGGNARNAIPRDAVAIVAVAANAAGPLLQAIEREADALREQWQGSELGLKLTLEGAGEAAVSAFTAASCRDTLRLLGSLPHGVAARSKVFAGVVETSSNLATVVTNHDFVGIHVSSRSFVEAQLQQQQDAVLRLGEQAGASGETIEGYPGWEPRADSRLLGIARAAYLRCFGKKPAVQVVHAGLECGVIVAKKPDLDAISFGPLIRFAHSPEECVAADTVASTAQLLHAVLADIALGKLAA